MKRYFPIILLTLVSSASAVTPQAAGPRYEGRIVLSTFGDMTRPYGFNGLIEAYHRMQPKVEISLELKGAGIRTEEYRTWLNTQLASGNPRPDIVSGNYSKDYDNYANFDYYRKAINPYTGRPWQETYNFNCQRERNVKGEFYIIGTEAVQVMWYYNQDIFDRLGLQVPKTWREFMAACERCRQEGYIPLSMRFNWRYWQWLSETLWDQYTRPYVQIIRAQPGDWCYDPSVDGVWKYDPTDPFNDSRITVNYARMVRAIRDKQIRYDTPEFIAFIRNLKEIAQYGPSNFLTGEKNVEEEYNLFLRQQAVMHLDLSRLMFEIEKDIATLDRRKGQNGGGEQNHSALKSFRWGTFTTPGQDNEYVKGRVRTVESVTGEYISIVKKNQKQTDMVMDFIMFWLSPTGTQAFFDAQLAANDFRPAGPLLVSGVKLPERAEQIFSRIKLVGDSESFGLNSIFNYPIKGSREDEDVRQILQQYLADKIGEEQIAAGIQDIMQRAAAERVKRSNMNTIFIDHPELDPGKY